MRSFERQTMRQAQPIPLVATVALLLASVTVVHGQQIVTTMTPSLVEEAMTIAADVKKAEKFLDAYVLKNRSGVIGVFTTPFSRVVRAAVESRKKYKPFSATDVTPEMVAPDVQVIAPSRPSMRDEKKIANVVAVVVLPRGLKDPGAAIQARTTEEMTETFKNLHGATFEGRGVVATFPLSVVTKENDVRVVFDNAVGPGLIQSCTDCSAELKLDKIR